MRVLDINTGIFLGNINYLFYKSEGKNLQNLISSLKHLNNEAIIISLLTTVNTNMYYSKMLPLNLTNNNYDLEIKT